MKIAMETVLATAKLARLDLTRGPGAQETPQTLNRLAQEFADIVTYIDILSEVEAGAVEPLYFPASDPQPPRADVARDSGTAQAILDEAPETRGDFFAVPAII